MVCASCFGHVLTCFDRTRRSRDNFPFPWSSRLPNAYLEARCHSSLLSRSLCHTFRLLPLSSVSRFLHLLPHYPGTSTPMAPKCEPLCHFGDRHVLPAESPSTPINSTSFSPGSTLQLSPIHPPVHTSSITNPLTQPTTPVCARDPEQAHPHLPTMMPPTTTSRSMTSYSISPSSRIGAHLILRWCTRLAFLSMNY